ncbi:MAG: lysozyme [Haloechinothrix sp.]
MRSTLRRGWRRSVGAATAMTACGLLLGSMTPASASVTGSDDAYVRKYDHPMGSQIAKVEGGRGGSAEARSTSGGVQGIDVSGWQRNVDWQYWWNKGKRFAYVKATEGLTYKNPYFTQQYNGSYNVGMIRGAYHFALPDKSTGAEQANYFAGNGGGWSRDGKTLPGVIDLEYNPYGSTCYGKSKAGMAAWIKSFHDTYQVRTGRYPVIYTSKSWWDQCVGTAGNFASTSPLWIARYSSSVGAMPHGWRYYTFWQYSTDPLDQNRFNGTYERLKALANG